MTNDFLKKNLFSIILPAYNEEENIKNFIYDMDKLNFNKEIIVVDNNSDDKTRDEISQTNAKYILEKKQGYGYAIKTGLKNCKYQWIFQTDGDAEYDVNDLKKLIKLKNRSDLVITYRFKKKYKTSRIIISWIYNAILRVLFLTNFKDISTGSRLIKKKNA